MADYDTTLRVFITLNYLFYIITYVLKADSKGRAVIPPPYSELHIQSSYTVGVLYCDNTVYAF